VNGDVLKAIKTRLAPLHFEHLEKDVVNGHLTAAKELSGKGSELPRAAEPSRTADLAIQPTVEAPLNIKKVTPNIPDDSRKSAQLQAVHSRAMYPAPHRGRDRRHDVREKNGKSHDGRSIKWRILEGC
jgi:hypothetical protein